MSARERDRSRNPAAGGVGLYIVCVLRARFVGRGEGEGEEKVLVPPCLAAFDEETVPNKYELSELFRPLSYLLHCLRNLRYRS